MTIKDEIIRHNSPFIGSLMYGEAFIMILFSAALIVSRPYNLFIYFQF